MRSMRAQFMAATAMAVAFLISVASAARAEAVDVALVLAADVSRSIDAGEFQLQRKGYAAALTSPRVLKAIQAGVHGSVAICFVEWSGPQDQAVISPWTIIRDDETAADFATILLKAPRSFAGRTAIGAGVDFAVAQLAAAGLEAERKVIDVSGDGTNNSGRPVGEARDEAVATGITINGLAIINQRPEGFYFQHTQPPEGLPAYYRDNVTGGPGAFLLVVEDFNTFGEAMTNKLLSEIAGLPPRETLAAGR